MKDIKVKIMSLALMVMTLFTLSATEKSNNDFSKGDGMSSVSVEVTNISIGTKDKLGRYSVKITVKASNLGYDEYVKMIGVKWGTVRNHPDHRDSRSDGSTETFSAAWHTNTTYYITPFVKTNKTDGEISGPTVSKRTP